MKLQYRIYNLSLEEQETYLNLRFQYNTDKAKIFLRKRIQYYRRIHGLAPLLYSTIIASICLNIATKSLKKSGLLNKK